MKISVGGLAAALAALALPAAATGEDTPAVVTAVYQCRTVSDDAARLACFDKAAAELEQAQTARTLVFGDEDAFPRFEGAELKSAMQEVRPNAAGRWIITLTDGTRWLQTDRVEFIFPPKPGDAVILRRGLLGNYRARSRATVFQVRQIG